VKGNQECGRSSNKGVSKGKNSQSKSRKRKDVNCYKCGKKRHIKRDCPDWKKNKVDEKEGSSTFANVMEEDSDAIDGDMFLCYKTQTLQSILWIIGFWTQHVLFT
jgi:hypothetical protein